MCKGRMKQGGDGSGKKKRVKGILTAFLQMPNASGIFYYADLCLLSPFIPTFAFPLICPASPAPPAERSEQAWAQPFLLPYSSVLSGSCMLSSASLARSRRAKFSPGAQEQDAALAGRAQVCAGKDPALDLSQHQFTLQGELRQPSIASSNESLHRPNQCSSLTCAHHREDLAVLLQLRETLGIARSAQNALLIQQTKALFAASLGQAVRASF